MELFPRYSEFEVLGINPVEASLKSNSSNSILKPRKNFKGVFAHAHNLKVCQEHLLKRYRLC
jgi:hypothetical protein